MVEVVRYNYRIRPGKQAERQLTADWHRCRYLWNDAVARFKDGEKLSFGVLSKSLTAKRSEFDWLREGAQVTQQQELRKFSQALNQSFKVRGRGKPRFKSIKNTNPSLEYTRNGLSIIGGRLVLAKCPPIPVVWSRALPSEPSSATVYRDNLGHWYVSFVVTRDVSPATPTEGGIGIDWGVTTTATTTDPAYDLPYQGFRKDAQARRAKYQRQMARRFKRGKPQSKGYKRAKRLAAKAAKKAQRQNTHTARVWAKRVVANHDTIAIEDFKPKFLAKSSLAKKSADAAIGTVKRILVEYATRADRRVVLVAPAYTTMTCSSCFARNKRLELDERTFTCTVCGCIEDRDRNAAKVILAVAERGHVTVEGVRHRSPFEESVLSEVKIPTAKAVGNR